MRHVKRPFSSRSRARHSPYRVNNFATAFAPIATGGAGFGAATFTDTLVTSITTLTNAGAVPANQYRGFTIGGIRYTSCFLPNSALVAATFALAVVSECWYVSELTQAGGPTITGDFLQKNEFAVANIPSVFPERILYRRSWMVQIGASGLAYPGPTDIDNVQVVRSKARVGDRDALWHRVEISNPTGTNVTFGGQVLAAIAIKYELD